MKKAVFVVFLFTRLWTAQAQQFWIQPRKYFYEVGERAEFSFVTGDGFIGGYGKATTERVTKLDHYYGTQVMDIKESVKGGNKNQVEVLLNEEGTHLVVMQSNAAFIEWEAEKFNTHLKEDGLDDAYNHRVKNNELNKAGRELSTRAAKLLLQVGSTGNDSFRKIAGLPIEIIPEKNPYAYKLGELVKFKVLFQGKPLFGAKVNVWNKKNNQTMVQPVYTMQDGTIEARISNTGSWMISVVHMIPSKTSQADWESFCGSLVFGIQ